MSVTDPIQYMRASIDAGDHWYFALLKAMARWDQAEEIIGDRRYRYLIGGEAFDWLLLAERLIDELGDTVTPEERETLLFHGHLQVHAVERIVVFAHTVRYPPDGIRVSAISRAGCQPARHVPAQR